MKTYLAKKENVNPQWYVIDLEGQVLGRAATKIADVLRGKHRADYTPSVDTGDFVIAINAQKVKVTGNKEDDKMYYWHTGHPGGLKERNFSQMREDKPEDIIKRAVKGMLPKNILGKNQLKKLKVFAGAEHNHEAQKPVELK